MTEKVKKKSEKRIQRLVEKIKGTDAIAAVSDSLKLVPEYYWYVPSSTTGRWHPKDEREPGGKVLHVCRVVKLLETFIEIYSIPEEYSDLLISAAILHDAFFCGLEGREKKKSGKLRSDWMHMYYPALVFSKLYDKHPFMIAFGRGIW